jgi:hypothetical protein
MLMYEQNVCISLWLSIDGVKNFKKSAWDNNGEQYGTANQCCVHLSGCATLICKTKSALRKDKNYITQTLTINALITKCISILNKEEQRYYFILSDYYFLFFDNVYCITLRPLIRKVSPSFVKEYQ